MAFRGVSSIIQYRLLSGRNLATGDRHELTRTDHSYQGDEAYNYDATGNHTDNTRVTTTAC